MGHEGKTFYSDKTTTGFVMPQASIRPAKRSMVECRIDPFGVTS